MKGGPELVRATLPAGWLAVANRLPVGRCLLAAGIPLLGLLTFGAEQGLCGGRYHLFSQWMGVPIAFLLWFCVMERSAKFRLRFHPLPFALSLLGFGLALSLGCWAQTPLPGWMKPMTRRGAIAVGTLAGLFVFLRIKDCLSRAQAEARPAAVALLLAAAVPCYSLLRARLWYRLSSATALAVYVLLRACGLEVAVEAALPRSFVVLRSPELSLQIAAACSGLDGVFLFYFLLSAVFLADWSLFSRLRLFDIYLVSFLYMFCVNALRVAALFLVGVGIERGYFPGWRPELVFWLFHSHLGWGLYLLAFGVFMAVLYAIATRGQKPGGPRAPLEAEGPTDAHDHS